MGGERWLGVLSLFVQCGWLRRESVPTRPEHCRISRVLMPTTLFFSAKLRHKFTSYQGAPFRRRLLFPVVVPDCPVRLATSYCAQSTGKSDEVFLKG
ncbi:hypothetical protein E2C01_038116 [Portunus trituberculatus]|uniref:Uncharacterized protein n=1 Tax=Portunus trituberculatus TaxID=210409 RepID=A0A5B7FH62_PORTR|nr:hypothetical protein [Portunus trituberculatus]